MKWTINQAFLDDDSDNDLLIQDLADRAPLVEAEFALAALLTAAEKSLEIFNAAREGAKARLPPPKPVIVRRRAKDFPYRAHVLRDMERLEFRPFLLRIKQDTSANATLRLFAEFVAFARKKCPLYHGFVLLCSVVMSDDLIVAYLICFLYT